MPVPPALAARLADTIDANLRRAYPYHLVATLLDDGDVRPPRELTPLFWGAYDWHSAVHSHWALARLGRPLPLDPAAVAAEHAFLARREGFERPYGLAWLLALAAELPRGALGDLERLARDRLVAWLGRIPVPIRSGEHASSAFAAALALDWARATGDDAAAAAITASVERLHGGDRDAPLHWEPGAHDFLSPALAIAALVARVRSPDDFARWLDGFAPALGRAPTIEPVTAIDRADGKLVHWDGLNLSRAWMLAEIARGLPGGDARAAELVTLAGRHGGAGVAALDDMAYAGSHWLPSFAVRWLTV